VVLNVFYSRFQRLFTIYNDHQPQQ